ncbi:MAG TPA: RNA polymerase sigma factor [Gemmataceae bacterium]
MLEELVPRVYRFALRLTGEVDAAEELTQETFLRGWRSRSELRDRRAALVWLLRIAANLWRDQLRRLGRPPARPGPLAPDLPEPGRGIDDGAADREGLAQALAALGRLPPRQREVLHLRACEELSIAEIARILGITEGAAKASLSAARQRMRAELKDLFDDVAGCRPRSAE